MADMAAALCAAPGTHPRLEERSEGPRCRQAVCGSEFFTWL